MSATGATDYRDGGAYYTPLHVADAMVARWAPMFRSYPAKGRHHGRMLRTLDMSAGGGAFPIALHGHGLVEPGSLEVMDLDPEARALRMPGAHLRTVAPVTVDPVLTGCLVTDPQQRPDLVCGNPPFGVPRPPEICKRCEGYCVITGSHGFEIPCPNCKGAGKRTFSKAIPVAQKHVERSCEVSDRWVLLLLRLAMVESDERIEMWENTPLRHMDVLTSRPEFMRVCTECAGTGLGALRGCYLPPPCKVCDGSGEHGKSGSDSAAYASFLFDHQYKGRPTFGWLKT